MLLWNNHVELLLKYFHQNIVIIINNIVILVILLSFLSTTLSLLSTFIVILLSFYCHIEYESASRLHAGFTLNTRFVIWVCLKIGLIFPMK